MGRARAWFWALLCAIGLAQGCSGSSSDETKSGDPTDPSTSSDPCVRHADALQRLSTIDSEYTDVPSGDDAKAKPYLSLVARLAVLQRKLAIENAVAKDFDAMAVNRFHYGAVSLEPAEALAEKDVAVARAGKVQADIDALVAEAKAAGTPLTDASGKTVDGERILRGTFFRDVATLSKEALAACRGAASSLPREKISDFVTDVGMVLNADAHELIEHTRIQRYLP